MVPDALYTQEPLAILCAFAVHRPLRLIKIVLIAAIALALLTATLSL
jgi:hypothetical protein